MPLRVTETPQWRETAKMLDLLALDGHGVTLRAGDGYKGPGLLVSSRNRMFALQNIILENFDVGMLLQNRNVFFMNVQFRNCRISLQYQHTLPGPNYLGGQLESDSAFSLHED